MMMRGPPPLLWLLLLLLLWGEAGGQSPTPAPTASPTAGSEVSFYVSSASASSDYVYVALYVGAPCTYTCMAQEQQGSSGAPSIPAMQASASATTGTASIGQTFYWFNV